MAKRQTFAEFEIKAREAHGERYSYPRQEYARTRTKVRIICKKHGEFEQRSDDHLKGCGCPKCSTEKQRTQQRGTLAEFAQKAAAVHNSRYAYPSQEYSSRRVKVIIVCPVHGTFSQTPDSHLRGAGCPKCSLRGCGASQRGTLTEFILKAATVHNGRYAYPSQVYVNALSLISITCPDHGTFHQSPASHLRGRGCPECSSAKRGDSQRGTIDKFVQKARALHNGQYTYPAQGYVNTGTPITIACAKHGTFLQSPDHHLQGRGCPKCASDKRGADQRGDFAELRARAARVHNDIYDYPDQDYKNNSIPITIVCKKHGNFFQSLSNHLQGKGCPNCTAFISSGEQEVMLFVLSLGLDATRGRENALAGLGSCEVDILIPGKKVAIEYNGIYWHSTAGGKTKNYHAKKTELLEILGYQLIHIFEDEWKENKAKVEARLASILSPKSLPRDFARRCVVKDIPWSSAKDFLTKHHLQGPGSSGSVSLGLFRGDDLLAVSIFGKPRYDKSFDWELLRFVSKGVVVGAAGKMLSYFRKQHAVEGQRLISYADRRWSQGKLYRALGFEFAGDTTPGYGYVKARKRYNRQMFQKYKLAKLFDNFDSALTEEENCRRNGYYRVYDCGVSRWVKTL